MSPADHRKAKEGDFGQGEKLTSAKREKYGTPSPSSGSPTSIPGSPGTGALGSPPKAGVKLGSPGGKIEARSPSKGKFSPSGYKK